MTDDEVETVVRRVVAEMLGVEPDRVASVYARGAVSAKMLGDLVARSGAQCKYVLVDLSGATSLAGKRPLWKS